MEIYAVLSWEVLPLVIELLASSPTLLLNSEWSMDSEAFACYWKYLLITAQRLCKCICLESQNLVTMISGRVFTTGNLTLCMESLTPVFSLLRALEAETLKTTFGFVRLCQRRARRRLKRGGEEVENYFLWTKDFLSASCNFLSVSCGLPGLISATLAVMISFCDSNLIQFAVSQLLYLSLIISPHSYHHQLTIIPFSEVWNPCLFL